MPEAPYSRYWSRVTVFSMVILGFAAADSVMLYAAEEFMDAHVEFVIFGLLVAQFVLIGMWGGLAPDGPFRRNVTAAIVLLIWYHSFIIGFIALSEWMTPRDTFELYWNGLCLLPSVTLAVQMPLWCVRMFLRWRFEHNDRPATMRPMTILHLMIATVVVAVSVGLVRAMFLDGGSLSSVWLPLAIFTGVAALVAMFGAVPALLAVFRTRGILVPLWLLVLLAYVEILTVGSFVVIYVFAMGQTLLGDELIAVSIAPFMATVGVVTPLVMARSVGWRLERGWTKGARENPPPRRTASPRRVAIQLSVTLVLCMLAYAVYAWTPWLHPVRQRVLLLWVNGNGLFENGHVVELVIDDGPVDLALVARFEHVRSLDLSYTNAKDLSPLAGLAALEDLNIRTTPVSDLQPIRSLVNLKYLDAGDTRVQDLRPLAGLSELSSLELDATQVVDVGPLATLSKLNSLSISGTHVSDIMPLADLVNLVELDAVSTQITALPVFPKLEALDISDTHVTTLETLALSPNLRTLSASIPADSSRRARVREVFDLKPLANLIQLVNIELGGTSVSDISPLAQLTSLEELSIARTQVADITPLAGLKLISALDLTKTQVRDVTAIRSLGRLQTLMLSGTQVTDLSAVGALTLLTDLHVSDTPVSDLTPLSGCMELATIDINRTAVTSLAPLAQLTSLNHLELMETGVTDLSPLETVQIYQVLIKGSAVSAAEAKRFQLTTGAIVD